MTSSLDTSPAARETPRPRPGRLVVLSSLRVLVAVTLVLAVAAGGYVAFTHHQQQARERARRHARIGEVRDAVVALAAGHTVYAPAAWDARQYPSLDDGRIVSWGTYGAVTVHLYQVRDRDISASTSRLRHLTSLATPESLCRLTAADRTGHGRGGMRTTRCLLVPGRHARIRVTPDHPQPGTADVLLSVALPDRGRYLNVWAVDETGTIAQDPAAWATGFLEDLRPYDITGYSVDDIDRAGADLWHAG